jgi:glucokinase
MGKSRKLFIGVDLGGTNIQAGVLDGDDRLLSQKKSKTKPEDGAEAVIGRIAAAVQEAVKDAGAAARDIGGLGIGAPGAVDVERGLVVTAVNLRWNNYNLAKHLGRATGLPVTIDNDVNVATWGEYVMGGAEYPDLLGVWVGTGIGGGLVLGGRLYYGYHQSAGEIGHTVLHADAPLGRRTLENTASRTAITQLLTQLIQSNHDSRISQLVDGDLSKVRSKVIAKALEDGDPLTKEVVRQAARYVGTAIANSVTLLSLPWVVVGGGFTTALGKPWVGWVKEAFEEHVFPCKIKSCRLTASQLGDDAGMIGAALLARARVEK